MIEAAEPMTGEEMEARLRQIGAERYHNLHRFHRRIVTMAQRSDSDMTSTGPPAPINSRADDPA